MRAATGFSAHNCLRDGQMSLMDLRGRSENFPMMTQELLQVSAALLFAAVVTRSQRVLCEDGRGHIVAVCGTPSFVTNPAAARSC